MFEVTMVILMLFMFYWYNYFQVNFPRLSADADVSGPSADLNTEVDGSIDANIDTSANAQASGDVDLDLPELQAADVNLPTVDVETSSPELDLDAPGVKVKGKKGGFSFPKFGGKGKAKVIFSSFLIW